MLKRVVVGFVTLSMLIACYMIYVRAFGHLTVLEPLPDRLAHPGKGAKPWPAADAPLFSRTKDLAQKVFGADSWQAKADIALNWERSGVVIFIADYEPVDSNSLRLVPFSLVHIQRPKNPGDDVQIATIEGKEAVLEFNEAVDVIRMTSAKPIAGRITGAVQIHADRGTPDPVDDIVAFTDYLEFRDEERKIWTDAPVRIVSADAVMTGTGASLDLHLDENKTRDMPIFQGVRVFTLRRDVQINMLAGGGSVMPGGPKPNADGDAAKEENKTPVTVTCKGPFTYDLETARGLFEDSVMMIRQTDDSKFDRLFCDTLEVHFQEPVGSERPENESEPAQFEFRRAVASGQTVRILSDAHRIEAVGTEMEHDAATGQTTLRGSPEVVATQEGNVLHGHELKFAVNEQGQRSAEAIGIGSMEARDPDGGDLKLMARWKEWAKIEPHGDRGQLLTLHGQAEVDQPGRGTLHADRIKVWIDEASGPAAAHGKRNSTRSPQWTPSRIEGIGNVSTKSDQLLLEAKDRLEMIFEDGSLPAKTGREVTDGAAASLARAEPTQSAAATGSGKSLDGRRGSDRSKRAQTEKTPATLHADRIRIKVIRDADRTELSDVWTEGSVKLDQPPDDNGSGAIVVRGDTLELKRIQQQNFLKVTGRPAHVALEDMAVDGANVGVDQPMGVAWVEGKGTMALPVTNSLDGKPLDPPGKLVIAWGANMFFNGEVAEFGGGVEAQQGNSRLRCQRLEAFLTERLDISAPKRKSENTAKIETLICTDDVVLEQIEFDEQRLQRFEHLESSMLKFTNSTGKIFARGPGLLRMLARGPNKMLAPQANVLQTKPTHAPNSENTGADQLNLTEIRFADRMEGDRGNQIANFFGHIDVVRAPVADENHVIDPDRLPPDGMRISSSELQVATKNGPEDKPYNEMVSTGNVHVESDAFSGRADRLSYHQLHDRIIFESWSGFATLYRQLREGERWDETRAHKIIYKVSTGQVKVEGGVMVDLQEREADRKNTPKAAPKKL